MRIGVAITLISILCIVDIKGQKNENNYFRESILIDKANDSFDNYKFSYAIVYCNKILKKNSSNTDIILLLAECYTKNNELSKAANCYAKAFSLNKNLPNEYKLKYGQALIAVGNYSRAKKWLTDYNQSVLSDIRANYMLSSIDNIAEYYKDSLLYYVNNLNQLNSAYSDINAVSFNKEIYFVSRNTKYSESFSDCLYDIFKADQKDSLKSISRLPNIINSTKHEGPIAINETDSALYFTRNIPSTNNSKLSILGLYKIHLPSEKSSLPVKINIKDFNNSMGHPTLSKDGNTLYFISDASNGNGGTDIYMSTKEGDQWTYPQNLGNQINTPGNEMFPFIYNDSILYYSSNGLGGLGGLDIFKINLNKKDDKPANLGYPINSNHDDFSLFLENDGKNGFFTSNRKGGKGNDDIYSFKVITIKKPKKSFAEFYTDNNDSIHIFSSDTTGVYAFKYTPSKNDSIIINTPSSLLEQTDSISYKTLLAKHNYIFTNDSSCIDKKLDNCEYIYLAPEENINLISLNNLNKKNTHLEVIRGNHEIRYNKPDSKLSNILATNNQPFSFISQIPYQFIIQKLDSAGNVIDSTKLTLEPNIRYDFTKSKQAGANLQFIENIRNRNISHADSIAGDTLVITYDILGTQTIGSQELICYMIPVDGDWDSSSPQAKVWTQNDELLIYPNDPFIIKMEAQKAEVNTSTVKNITVNKLKKTDNKIITGNKPFSFISQIPYQFIIQKLDSSGNVIDSTKLTLEPNIRYDFTKINQAGANLLFIENIKNRNISHADSIAGDTLVIPFNILGTQTIGSQELICYMIPVDDHWDSSSPQAKVWTQNDELLIYPNDPFIIKMEAQKATINSSTVNNIPLSTLKSSDNNIITGNEPFSFISQIPYQFIIQKLDSSGNVIDSSKLTLEPNIRYDFTKSNQAGANLQFIENIKNRNISHADSIAGDTLVITYDILGTQTIGSQELLCYMIPVDGDWDSSYPQAKVWTQNDELLIYPNDPFIVKMEALKATVKTKSVNINKLREKLTVSQQDSLQQIKLIYRVQVAASKTPLSVQKLKSIYKGDLEIKEFEEEGYHKYYIADSENYFEAKQYLKESHVSDCFIAAYTNNKKLPLQEALSTQYKKRMVQTGLFNSDSIVDIITVNFKSNEFKLEPKDISYTEQAIIQPLLLNNNYKVIVNGHTDITGTSAYNIGLSEERAQFVKNILINKGIDSNRVSTYSFGESKILKSYSKNETRASVNKANRRVEIIVISIDN